MSNNNNLVLIHTYKRSFDFKIVCPISKMLQSRAVLDSIVWAYHKSHVRCGGKEELAAREPVKILTENSRPKLIKLAELCARVPSSRRPAYTSSSNFLIVCAWITTTERSGQTARVSPVVRVSNPKLCLSTLCPHCTFAVHRRAFGRLILGVIFDWPNKQLISVLICGGQ